jgi:hypothetical protein
MDDFCTLGIFNDTQLYDLNLCQIYLQVTTLSDIVNGLGKKITDEAFKAQRLTNRFSALKWPQQLILTMKQWNLLKKALKVSYTSSGQILKQCLGKWTGTSSQMWYNFYDPQDKLTLHIIQL